MTTVISANEKLKYIYDRQDYLLAIQSTALRKILKAEKNLTILRGGIFSWFLNCLSHERTEKIIALEFEARTSVYICCIVTLYLFVISSFLKNWHNEKDIEKVFKSLDPHKNIPFLCGAQDQVRELYAYKFIKFKPYELESQIFDSLKTETQSLANFFEFKLNY